MNSWLPKNLVDEAIKCICMALLILWPFLYLTTIINDDAFVYFTYAKNFARGNLFAYDPRGIPSEGFTSLLYMILLVPFELLHFPMSAASLIVNVVAVIGMAVLSCKIFTHVFPEQRDRAWLVMPVFLFFVYLDANLTTLMGWGLETILSGFCFLFLIERALAGFQSGKLKEFNTVLVLFGVCVLCRPENLLVAAPWVFLCFATQSSRKTSIRSCMIFVLVSLLYLFVKYLWFGDVVPTGFYRKVSSKSYNLGYLRGYISDYSIVFHVFYWTLLGVLIRYVSVLRRNKIIKLFFVGLVFSGVGMVLFVLKIDPIQGYLQRYLTLITVFVYLGISLSVVTLFGRRSLLRIGVAALIVFILFGGSRQKLRSNPVALFKETEEQMERDPYAHFARFLQNHVRRPDEITLMFGDAGSIPYFFDCKFIDINGLTEPYLARMFRAQDREKKVIEYVKSQKVDMAVLAVESNWMNLTKDSQKLPQGPLSKANEYAALLRQMKADGFVYAGSIHSPAYDVHFGLNKFSSKFDELNEVLGDYISTSKGFIKDSHLQVEFSSGDVVFENSRLSDSDLPVHSNL